MSLALLVASAAAQRKPHPEPILKAAARLELLPAKCIHVGDQAGDIEAKGDCDRAGADG